MDQRCTPEFLATLPAPSSHLQLATGHGCATLFWLTRHKGEVVTDMGYDCSGSVMDYVVARLCGLKKPVTSVQVAASMGYFNTQLLSWNTGMSVYKFLLIETQINYWHHFYTCLGHNFSHWSENKVQ